MEGMCVCVVSVWGVGVVFFPRETQSGCRMYRLALYACWVFEVIKKQHSAFSYHQNVMQTWIK
jgi:hypothetical protein